MPFRKGDVTVRQIDARSWQLLEEVRYEGRDSCFVVPVGFTTDFASVPQILVWLIPRYGVYTKAAILHDFLCRTALVNRADADGIFRRALRELGVSVLRRWMMWAAVRVQSRLSDALLRQRGAWALVALPSLVFLVLPALVVGVWLLVFLALEWIVYPVAGRQADGTANKPTLSGAPDEEAEERAGGLPGERTTQKSTTPASRAPVGH